MRKLAPDESVLSPAELVAQQLETTHLGPNSTHLSRGDGSSVGLGDDEATEDESVYEEAIEVPVPAVAPKRGRTVSGRQVAAGQQATALFNSEGVRAAAVKLRQLKEAMSMSVT